MRQIATWVRENAANGPLIALGIVALLLWGFVELADEVLEGETHAFDVFVMQALRNVADLSDPLGPIWIEELARDITALGGIAVLSLLVLAAAGFLWLIAQHRLALFVLVAVGTGVALSLTMKMGFDRPRPDLTSAGTAVYTASFPSGHSLMSAVVYLTLGALLARTMPRRAAKVYVMALAVLVVVMVGISRIYLGVHWPTDVLAGWALGAGWALLAALVANWLDQRGAVDHAPDDSHDSADNNPEGG
ncbi:phosphatase PAP2 family protein [Rhodobacteraceae bacterium KMM 6894]|nr:phosphatase PAP2 family protein [Rhodobacteraceae bacterium KMM 6894]